MPVPYSVTSSGIIIREYTDTSNCPVKPVRVKNSSITVPKLEFGKKKEESSEIQSTE